MIIDFELDTPMSFSQYGHNIPELTFTVVLKRDERNSLKCVNKYLGNASLSELTGDYCHCGDLLFSQHWINFVKASW